VNHEHITLADEAERLGENRTGADRAGLLREQPLDTGGHEIATLSF
jgi:hypothetical protein